MLESYYQSMGYIPSALELPEEMARIQPENSRLLKKLSHNQHAPGKSDLAVLTYKIIVELLPDSTASWYGLGKMQSLNKGFEHAAISFQEVFELEPRSIVPKIVLIKLDLQFNRIEQAEKMSKPYDSATPRHLRKLCNNG